MNAKVSAPFPAHMYTFVRECHGVHAHNSRVCMLRAQVMPVDRRHPAASIADADAAAIATELPLPSRWCTRRRKSVRRTGARRTGARRTGTR